MEDGGPGRSIGRWSTFGLLFAAVLALALRAPQLAIRPMHNDEAVNAIKLRDLWEGGSYRYDPNEHHGPTLYYATLLLSRLTGAPAFPDFSETRLRALTVLFGLGLLVLLPLLADGLGRSACGWAALLTAVSSAMVFYSRYYIHEMLLAFFTLLALATGWRYSRTRHWGWALLTGAAVGLMQATKETFAITLAAAGLALALNQVWNRLLDASGLPFKAPPLKYWHLAAGLGVWLGVALILFSSFFTNPSGPLDSLRTYMPWLQRVGGDSPHLHPWTFYFQRLLWFRVAKGPVWSEALIAVLFVLGAWAAFARKGLADGNASFVRFLALYSLAGAAAYSLISYKTPWCLLTFWNGMILVAGVGAMAILQRAKNQWAKAALVGCLLVAAGQLAGQAWQASVPFAADRRNPYVYAQTSPDLLNAVDQLEQLARVHPDHHQMMLKVMAPEDDYWPLPWYLRRFNPERIGWYHEVPPDPYAPVMIVSSKFHAGLDEKQTHLMVRYTELRPGVFFELYVQLHLWRAYLAQRTASAAPP